MASHDANRTSKINEEWNNILKTVDFDFRPRASEGSNTLLSDWAEKSAASFP